MRKVYSSPVLLVAILMAALAVAAVAEPVRIAVPFRLDQGDIFSSMVMEVEKTVIGSLSLEQSAGQPLPPDQAAFFDLVRTLRDGDVEAVMGLSKLSPNENPAARMDLIGGYQTAFAGEWDTLKLLSRYDLNEYATYIWEINGPKGPYIRSFSLSGHEDGYKWIDDTQQSLPNLMDTLLMKAEQLRVDGLVAPADRSTYRYAEQLRGSGMTLLFNGTVMSWDVFSEPVPDLPVAKLYHEAYAALKNRDMDGFASHFTPYSAAKFMNWIAAMPATEFEAWFAEMVAGMEIRFILDADPVFVIYYNTPDGVRNNTVVRQGDQLMFTNFYIGGFIDKLLEDRELFVKPIVARLVSGDPDPVPLVAVADGAAQDANAVPADESVPPVKQQVLDSETIAMAAAPVAAPVEPAGLLKRLAWLLLLLPIPVALYFIFKRKPDKS